MLSLQERYESVAVPATATRILPPAEEDETQELPPVPAGRAPGLRRAWVENGVYGNDTRAALESRTTL